MVQDENDASEEVLANSIRTKRKAPERSTFEPKKGIRYTPKDAARWIKYSKVLLPPPVDLETLAINVGGRLVIDRAAKKVEQKLTKLSEAKKISAATPDKMFYGNSTGTGHIMPKVEGPKNPHATGPEPAIRPREIPPKPAPPVKPLR